MKLKQILPVFLSSIVVFATAADGQTPKKDSGDSDGWTVIGRTNIVGTLRSYQADGTDVAAGLFGSNAKVTITVYQLEMPVIGTKTNRLVSLSTGDTKVDDEFKKLTGKKVAVDGVLSHYKDNVWPSLQVSSIKEQK